MSHEVITNVFLQTHRVPFTNKSGKINKSGLISLLSPGPLFLSPHFMTEVLKHVTHVRKSGTNLNDYFLAF